MEKLTCLNCGAVDYPFLEIQQFHNQTQHLRAECPHCGAWIKWLPKKYLPLIEIWGDSHRRHNPQKTPPPPPPPPPILKPTKPPAHSGGSEQETWGKILESCPPLTRSLFKKWGTLIRVDHNKGLVFVEVANYALYKIAFSHQTALELAIKQITKKHFSIVLFTFEPLIALSQA